MIIKMIGEINDKNELLLHDYIIEKDVKGVGKD